MSPPTPIHGDDVAEHVMTAGEISVRRKRLGAAADARRIGCSHYVVPAGARQMPVHVHSDEEEIFFVLAGGGLSITGDQACSVAAGDTIAQPTSTDGGAPHTMLAGDDGLEVLVFGTGSDTHLTWLPRPKVMWAGPRWLPADGPHPFAAEAEAGPLERPEPGERTSNVVAFEDCDPGSYPGAEVRWLGARAGAMRSGLKHIVLPAGATGSAFHCHALEEEMFLILDGDGSVRVGDDEHELRTGSLFARPPATGVAHQIRAGALGITYLAYGTRVDGDSVLYPDEGKVLLRGLGVTLDVPRTS